MNKWRSVLRHLMNSETAVSSIEYALLASLIAVVCVGAVAAMGSSLSAMYLTVCKAVAGTAGC